MEKALYLKPIHQYAYRKLGRLPKVINLVSFKPAIHEERPCVKIQYNDGEIDYVPLKDITNGNYEIVNDNYILGIDMAKGQDVTSTRRLANHYEQLTKDGYDPKNLSMTHEEMDSVIKAFEQN